jgi:hypothetical protein
MIVYINGLGRIIPEKTIPQGALPCFLKPGILIGKTNVVEIDIVGGHIEGSTQAVNFTISVNYIRSLPIVLIYLKNCVNLASQDMVVHYVLNIVFKDYFL